MWNARVKLYAVHSLEEGYHHHIQDPLGRQGVCVDCAESSHVWVRPLANGDVAIALLNLAGFGPAVIIGFNHTLVGLSSPSFLLRDLMKQQDVSVTHTHACTRTRTVTHTRACRHDACQAVLSNGIMSSTRSI